jgi:hypothetical protein
VEVGKGGRAPGRAGGGGASGRRGGRRRRRGGTQRRQERRLEGPVGGRLRGRLHRRGRLEVRGRASDGAAVYCGLACLTSTGVSRACGWWSGLSGWSVFAPAACRSTRQRACLRVRSCGSALTGVLPSCPPAPFSLPTALCPPLLRSPPLPPPPPPAAGRYASTFSGPSGFCSHRGGPAFWGGRAAVSPRCVVRRRRWVRVHACKAVAARQLAEARAAALWYAHCLPLMAF